MNECKGGELIRRRRGLVRIRVITMWRKERKVNAERTVTHMKNKEK